jgi:chemotaxis protein methyltransferase CheR
MDVAQGLDAGYEAFKRRVYRKTGLDLNSYKQTQMERRLRTTMERAGAANFQHYCHMLENDDRLMQEFLRRVTINVSELFRNPDQFRILEERVLPDLMSRSENLRAWSAGCSCGQEAYSLAICLAEAGPPKGFSVLGTDIDERALVRARRGVFSPAETANVSDARRSRWFSCEAEDLAVVDSLRGSVRFERLDLLRDSFPTGMDLILCRNVVIYFTECAKAELYGRFLESLKPGGYLFVGSTERIRNYGKIGYLNPYMLFYQKPIVWSDTGEIFGAKNEPRSI